MKNVFTPGDRVSVIDENIDGKVVRVSGKRIFIKTTDGFEMDYFADELVKTGNENFPIQFNQAVFKEEPQKRKKLSFKKQRSVPAMEVDLHIDKLIESTRGMDNYDILSLQLDTAKRQLEFAIRKKIQRVIFIHGVGEGVLKTELEYLLRKYDLIEYYDADYQKYGLGATEVYISQKAL